MAVVVVSQFTRLIRTVAMVARDWIRSVIVLCTLAECRMLNRISPFSGGILRSRAFAWVAGACQRLGFALRLPFAIAFSDVIDALVCDRCVW